MPVRDIKFIPQYIAEHIHPERNWGIISITDPGDAMANLQEGWGAVLKLAFHDIDQPLGSYKLFHNGHAKSIVKFLDEIRNNGIDKLIVHCHAGISRSAAVAKFAADYLDVENFNHKYTLYNKHVYRELTQIFNAGAYEYRGGGERWRLKQT